MNTLMDLYYEATLDETCLLRMLKDMREAHCAMRQEEPDEFLHHQWWIVHGFWYASSAEESVLQAYDPEWVSGVHRMAEEAMHSRATYYKAMQEIVPDVNTRELEGMGMRPLAAKLALLWDCCDPLEKEPEGYCEGDTFSTEVH